MKYNWEFFPLNYMVSKPLRKFWISTMEGSAKELSDSISSTSHPIPPQTSPIANQHYGEKSSLQITNHKLNGNNFL